MDERFGGSPASTICWRESFEQKGWVAAELQGGERRLQQLEAQAALILTLRLYRPTVASPELSVLLGERRFAIDLSDLFRFFRHHAVPHKEYAPR